MKKLQKVNASIDHSREEIMEAVASYFHLDNIEMDINSYDWQSGCYISDGKWLSLAEIVYFVEAYYI